MTRRTRHQSKPRTGTTAVEVAFIMPVFIAFLFGLFEYGHTQCLLNLLKGATRTAARYGANEEVTTAELEDKLRSVMGDGFYASQTTILVKDASVYDDPSGTPPQNQQEYEQLPDIEVSSAVSRQLFLVRATIDYNAVSLLPVPWFFDNVQLSGQALKRHE